MLNILDGDTFSVDGLLGYAYISRRRCVDLVDGMSVFHLSMSFRGR
jgi:hypothetical protein